MSMKVETIGNATLYLGTMEETIGGIDGVDHIFTDPPYLYLKQDFDRPWDEPLFLDNVKRMLPDNGFIALFGRGTSFYRWNMRLADMGFKFKEEIIWRKTIPGSYLNAIKRQHETLSVFTKKNGHIRTVRTPYLTEKAYNIASIAQDIKRIKTSFNNTDVFDKIERFLQSGEVEPLVYDPQMSLIGTCPRQRHDRALSVVKAIARGQKETTVLSENPQMADKQHPTQKPVRLAERILALISDPGDVIYDPFMGSGSFGVACINTGRKYIGSEMKPEYFDIAVKRIREASALPGLFDGAAVEKQVA
jgi:site-specific DNA-methyltransferase (adenine-specific)